MPKTATRRQIENDSMEPAERALSRRGRRSRAGGATLAQLAARFAVWINQAELGPDDDRMEYPDPDDVLLEIGHRISVARTHSGLSQTVLAHAVGYSAANPISKLENGQMASLDIVTLARIAHAFGVDVDFLVRPAVLAAREVMA